MRTQIILADLGDVPSQAIGHEQGFKRPCLVIQTLDYAELAVVIPFTSQTPPAAIYSIVSIQSGAGGLTVDSFALCHQIRSISYKRLIRSISYLPDRDFNKILTVLADFLDI